jgi:hypothetical protein
MVVTNPEKNKGQILLYIGIVVAFVLLCFFTYHYFVQTPQLPRPQLPTPQFPRPPVDLGGKLNSPVPFGSFEKSFVWTYNCTPESETYSTNYIFVSGSDGPHRVLLQLVPWNETPMYEDILNVHVEPVEFDVVPNHLYTVGVGVTVGPNVTGESMEYPGGGGWSHNPDFLFTLRVFVDGKPVPDADDKVTVIKWCKSLHQTWEMQNSPDFYFPEGHEILLHAGESKTVSVSIRNSGGGIREIHFESGGYLPSQSYGFPLDPTTLIPLPTGMNVRFVPPVVIGSNFRTVNQTMTISTTPETPDGEYPLPLVLCYRGLDTTNRTSTYFPFAENAGCPMEGIFTVKVKEKIPAFKK